MNGISVKQAIEIELEGKATITNEDTVKCIKHLATGIDNMNEKVSRVEKNESRLKWHEKIFGAVYAATIGTIIAWWTSR